MKTNQEYDQLYAFVAYSRKLVSSDQEFERSPIDVQMENENMSEDSNVCILYGIDML